MSHSAISFNALIPSPEDPSRLRNFDQLSEDEAMLLISKAQTRVEQSGAQGRDAPATVNSVEINDTMARTLFPEGPGLMILRGIRASALDQDFFPEDLATVTRPGLRGTRAVAVSEPYGEEGRVDLIIGTTVVYNSRHYTFHYFDHELLAACSFGDDSTPAAEEITSDAEALVQVLEVAQTLRSDARKGVMGLRQDVHLIFLADKLENAVRALGGDVPVSRDPIEEIMDRGSRAFRRGAAELTRQAEQARSRLGRWLSQFDDQDPHP